MLFRKLNQKIVKELIFSTADIYIYDLSVLFPYMNTEHYVL